MFLDQLEGPLLLDEAPLVPQLFPEIKRKVDQAKRSLRQGERFTPIDFWITGSNQTLLSTNVKESLAGRSEFYKLNTLSVHEIGRIELGRLILLGGWPELHAEPKKSPVQYLNGLISTFIEKDIVQAAGIQKKSAFTKTLQLLAGQVGELSNFSLIASATGVESTTIQSWTLILQDNEILKLVLPFMNTLNKRLIKTPKVYFEDVGLAVRFQGWTEFQPLFVSPQFGHLFENLVYSEISRFFTNSLMEPKVYFVRDKRKVEVDFLVELPNQRYVAIEAKVTPKDFSAEQIQLLNSLRINIVERWVVNASRTHPLSQSQALTIYELYDSLRAL